MSKIMVGPIPKSLGDLFVLVGLNLQAQCDYNLDNLSHVDCNGDNTGEIDITITNSSVTCSWLYPDGSTTNTSQNISNLYAGEYNFTILADWIFPESLNVIVDSNTNIGFDLRYEGVLFFDSFDNLNNWSSNSAWSISESKLLSRKVDLVRYENF